jgi:hypothetical protein
MNLLSVLFHKLLTCCQIKNGMKCTFSKGRPKGAAGTGFPFLFLGSQHDVEGLEVGVLWELQDRC